MLYNLYSNKTCQGLLYLLSFSLSRVVVYFEGFSNIGKTFSNYVKDFHIFTGGIMIGFERKQEILKYLEQKRSATVKDLSEHIYTSEASVRRDLEALEREGFVKRFYGGVALSRYINDVVPLSLRDTVNAASKEEIARQAAELVSDDCTIIIDGSSTARRMIKYIENRKNLRIFTNNARIFSEAGTIKASLYSTGGAFDPKNNVFVGPMAESFIRSISADIVFFSSQGISDDGEISDVSEEETAIRRAMLERANYKVFLCDASKIGVRKPFRVCSKDDVDRIICDVELPW